MAGLVEHDTVKPQDYYVSHEVIVILDVPLQ